jgi:hypothetical protein
MNIDFLDRDPRFSWLQQQAIQAALNDANFFDDSSGMLSRDLLLQAPPTQEINPRDNKSEKNKSARTSAKKYKKAPDAPRRFRSAFIFFSIDKHREFRESLEAGNKLDGIDSAKVNFKIDDKNSKTLGCSKD